MATQIEKIYYETLRKRYSRMWPIIPPISDYNLGDYGVYEKGYFQYRGNIIQNLKDFELELKEHPEYNEIYNSSEIVFHETTIDGELDNPFNENHKIGLELEFLSDNAVFLELQGLQMIEIKNKDLFAKKVVREYMRANLEWDDKFVVITQIYNVKKALYFTSQKAGTRIKALAQKKPDISSLLQAGVSFQYQRLTDNTLSFNTEESHKSFIGELAYITGFWKKKLSYRGESDSMQYFFPYLPQDYDEPEEEKDWHNCMVSLSFEENQE
ncbi:MAG: hypothetical protein R3B93_10265 [Bacteroidia bacterium]